MYHELPKSIKNNFIQESQYKTTLNNILETKVSENIKEKSYITGVKIKEYKSLEREDITMWIKQNIEHHLKHNVSDKKEIMAKFNEYLEKTNTKNNSNKDIEKLLDQEIQAYYTKQNTTIKLLNDTKDEYYVLIH